jgi:predicted  nucleic acid-binding Zn-ribbon protein
VDGPLRELARLVRVQADIDRRAYALAAEAREARERERALRDELEAAQERIEELDATAREALEREQALQRQRRVRIGLALGRPLDLIRRPFR